MWIDDPLDDVEPKLAAIVSLSDSVPREQTIVRSEQLESTLKLS